MDTETEALAEQGNIILESTNGLDARIRFPCVSDAIARLMGAKPEDEDRILNSLSQEETWLCKN